MPAPCVVNLDNVRVIKRIYCTRRITKLSPARMREVCEALRRAIDC